jgi:hypothetical protein
VRTVRSRSLPAAYLQARLVALFLLSVGAIYGAYLGWDPARLAHPANLAWPPIAVGLAVVAGAALDDRLSSVAERTGRGRLRAVGGIAQGSVFFLALLGILAGEPSAVATAIVLLMLSQPFFLLLAGLGRGYVGTLLNALALTLVAALGGGERTVVAVLSHAAFLVFFLVTDHAARKLADYPVETVPPVGVLLGQGLVPVAVATGVLGAFFALVPPQPYTPLKRVGGAAPLPAGELAQLLLEVGVIFAVAGIAFYLILRFATGRGREGGDVLAEKVLARGRAEPSPPRAQGETPDAAGWGARIVRLYVRMGKELARLGVFRRPDQTPRDFARKLAPEGAVEGLTDVFMRARYGELEMSEEDFKSAQAASRSILDHFRRGPGRGGKIR